MTSSTTVPSGSERVRYFSRQLITAEDMRAEQEYFLNKLRRHNRMLHGSGVVCGLEVSDASDSAHPQRVAVSCGYALTPLGDEVCVTKLSYLDVDTCGMTSGDPCLPTTSSSVVTTSAGTTRGDVFVGVCYAECASRPVRVTAAGCGCGDSSCDYSRTADGWRLCCWPVPANWTHPSPPSTCAHVIDALWTCHGTPEDACVILARVSFSPTNGTTITGIDKSVRQWVFSTAALQGIACPTTPSTGTGTEPTNNVVLKVGEHAVLSAGPGTAYSSSRPVVATVDSSGVVTGLAAGTAVITARLTATNVVVATWNVKVA